MTADALRPECTCPNCQSIHAELVHKDDYVTVVMTVDDAVIELPSVLLPGLIEVADKALSQILSNQACERILEDPVAILERRDVLNDIIAQVARDMAHNTG